MKNLTESNPPRPNECLLPILMLKIQPNDPKDRLQIPEDTVENWKTNMKNCLPGNLAQKIVYQDMNKRRTIYNLGFRLTGSEEIELLHTCKDIYEGELGMYSCTVPYAPLEYVNNNSPPVEETEPPREQRQNTRTRAVAAPSPGATAEASAPPAAAPTDAPSAGVAPPAAADPAALAAAAAAAAAAAGAAAPAPPAAPAAPAAAAPAVADPAAPAAAAPAPPNTVTGESSTGNVQQDARAQLRQMMRSQRGL